MRANLGFEHGHLKDLAALLFAARETVVHGAGGKLPIDLQQVHFGVEPLVVGGGLELLAFGQAGLEGGTEEVGDRDAGNFARVLKGQKQSGAGALVGFLVQDGLAVEKDFAARDPVVGMAGDGFRQRRLASAVGPHDRMHFAAPNGEREVLDDFLFADGDVEIFDFEGRHVVSVKVERGVN